MPDRQALIQGTVEATRAAVKRLDGDAARLVLVVESDARHRALGSAAGDEWTAIKNEGDARVPRVGWLCQSVAADGRGVRPADAHGPLLRRAPRGPPRGSPPPGAPSDRREPSTCRARASARGTRSSGRGRRDTCPRRPSRVAGTFARRPAERGSR